MSVGVYELILILINLVLILLPLGAVVVMAVLFYQKIRQVEEKLDKILENQAGQTEVSE